MVGEIRGWTKYKLAAVIMIVCSSGSQREGSRSTTSSSTCSLHGLLFLRQGHAVLARLASHSTSSCLSCCVTHVTHHLTI
jgi:hypothetical protein